MFEDPPENPTPAEYAWLVVSGFVDVIQNGQPELQVALATLPNGKFIMGAAHVDGSGFFPLAEVLPRADIDKLDFSEATVAIATDNDPEDLN